MQSWCETKIDNKWIPASSLLEDHDFPSIVAHGYPCIIFRRVPPRWLTFTNLDDMNYSTCTCYHEFLRHSRFWYVARFGRAFRRLKRSEIMRVNNPWAACVVVACIVNHRSYRRAINDLSVTSTVRFVRFEFFVVGILPRFAKSRKLEEPRRPKSLKLLSTWFSACVRNFPLPRTNVFVAVRSEVHNFSLRPIDRRSDSTVHPFEHALLFFERLHQLVLERHDLFSPRIPAAGLLDIRRI